MKKKKEKKCTYIYYIPKYINIFHSFMRARKRPMIKKFTRSTLPKTLFTAFIWETFLLQLFQTIMILGHKIPHMILFTHYPFLAKKGSQVVTINHWQRSKP